MRENVRVVMNSLSVTAERDLDHVNLSFSVLLFRGSLLGVSLMKKLVYCVEKSIYIDQYKLKNLYKNKN